MEKLEFIKTNEKEEKVICEAIATYHHEDNNKDYIIYTDYTYDENNKLKIYYSLYKRKDDNIELIKIEDVEDEKIGLELLKEVLKELNK